jgi:hypothetical protein
MKKVIIDKRAPEAVKASLIDMGYSLIQMPPHPALPAPVSAHPDMLLFPAPDAIYCTRSYAEIANRELECIAAAAKRPIRYIDAEYGTQYPHDVLLNAACVGNTLFGLPQATAKELTSHKSFTLATIKQGYAKCSGLVFGGCLVTADGGIARAGRVLGGEVCRICPGFIALPGYDCGFIGGASGVVGQEVLFFGDPTRHPDGQRILSLISASGFKWKGLSDLPLTDYGGLTVIF